jgi:hypothetical protein
MPRPYFTIYFEILSIGAVPKSYILEPPLLIIFTIFAYREPLKTSVEPYIRDFQKFPIFISILYHTLLSNLPPHNHALFYSENLLYAAILFLCILKSIPKLRFANFSFGTGSNINRKEKVTESLKRPAEMLLSSRNEDKWKTCQESKERKRASGCDVRPDGFARRYPGGVFRYFPNQKIHNYC